MSRVGLSHNDHEQNRAGASVHPVTGMSFVQFRLPLSAAATRTVAAKNSPGNDLDLRPSRNAKAARASYSCRC